ncbi:hypothetical protein COCVIDRAFT_16335 [Bipolaris victoriae FI3]|uniref:Uncharacterized protein n=1 Tax=Bipolaris victoriae (strain FI3) TaxID=930091 RepID=W7EER6_BIPV3|nr:hypothetical protein COCVIDRAFT_16335 [Bipolaris victoriae FI3]
MEFLPVAGYPRQFVLCSFASARTVDQRRLIVVRGRLQKQMIRHGPCLLLHIDREHIFSYDFHKSDDASTKRLVDKSVIPSVQKIQLVNVIQTTTLLNVTTHECIPARDQQKKPSDDLKKRTDTDSGRPVIGQATNGEGLPRTSRRCPMHPLCLRKAACWRTSI